MHGRACPDIGQVLPGAAASSPHTYFKQQIHRSSAVLSYFYVKKRHVCDTHLLVTQSPHKFYGTYEINQANKKQRLALHRLENGEIKSDFATFLLENNTKLDNWKSLLECMLVCLCSQVILSILQQISQRRTCPNTETYIYMVSGN